MVKLSAGVTFFATIAMVSGVHADKHSPLKLLRGGKTTDTSHMGSESTDNNVPPLPHDHYQQKEEETTTRTRRLTEATTKPVREPVTNPVNVAPLPEIVPAPEIFESPEIEGLREIVASPKYIFLTNNEVQGNIGRVSMGFYKGLEGADRLCQSSAKVGRLPTGTYLAFVATSNETSPAERFNPEPLSYYINTRGEEVAANLTQLVSGSSLSASFGFDERGKILVDTQWASNVKHDGTLFADWVNDETAESRSTEWQLPDTIRTEWTLLDDKTNIFVDTSKSNYDGPLFSYLNKDDTSKINYDGPLFSDLNKDDTAPELGSCDNFTSKSPTSLIWGQSFALETKTLVGNELIGCDKKFRLLCVQQ